MDKKYIKYEPCSNIENSIKGLNFKGKLHKLISIEGTDCSGKQTQSEMLIKRLLENNIVATKRQYPNYDSPTGYIIGAFYLGKPHIGESVFPEGARNVDPIVAGQLYASDRYADKFALIKELTNNVVVLDRYVESNLAYQAGFIESKKERERLYNYFYKLEYGLNGLIKPNIKILIYMPLEYSNLLKEKRSEVPDEMEKSINRLKLAEKAYLEIAKKYKFKIINCIKQGSDFNNPKLSDIKSKKQINDEIFSYVIKKL